MIATRLLFTKAGVPLNNKDTSHFPFSLKKKRNTLSVWIFYYKRLILSSDRSCSFHIIFLKVCFLFLLFKKKRVENERNCFLKKKRINMDFLDRVQVVLLTLGVPARPFLLLLDHIVFVHTSFLRLFFFLSHWLKEESPWPCLTSPGCCWISDFFFFSRHFQVRRCVGEKKTGKTHLQRRQWWPRYKCFRLMSYLPFFINSFRSKKKRGGRGIWKTKIRLNQIKQMMTQKTTRQFNDRWKPLLSPPPGEIITFLCVIIILGRDKTPKSLNIELRKALLFCCNKFVFILFSRFTFSSRL